MHHLDCKQFKLDWEQNTNITCCSVKVMSIWLFILSFVQNLWSCYAADDTQLMGSWTVQIMLQQQQQNLGEKIKVNEKSTCTSLWYFSCVQNHTSSHVSKTKQEMPLFSIVTWMLRIILMEVHIYSWTWSLTDLTKLANVAAKNEEDTINVCILPCPHEPEHLVAEKTQSSIHLHRWLSLVVRKYVDLKDYSKINLCTKIETKCTHVVAQCVFSMLVKYSNFFCYLWRYSVLGLVLQSMHNIWSLCAS